MLLLLLLLLHVGAVAAFVCRMALNISREKLALPMAWDLGTKRFDTETGSWAAWKHNTRSRLCSQLCKCKMGDKAVKRKKTGDIIDQCSPTPTRRRRRLLGPSSHAVRPCCVPLTPFPSGRLFQGRSQYCAMSLTSLRYNQRYPWSRRHAPALSSLLVPFLTPFFMPQRCPSASRPGSFRHYVGTECRRPVSRVCTWRRPLLEPSCS